jgi:hypothetical protein
MLRLLLAPRGSFGARPAARALLGERASHTPRPMSTRAGARPSVHALLGICATSSHADVKRAYLSLALRIHPDKVSPDEYEVCERH